MGWLSKILGTSEHKRTSNKTAAFGGTPQAGVTYLYLLRRSGAPSEELMRSVLSWWRSQRGPNFEILGGQRADNVPTDADMYVMGILLALCATHGFAAEPEKLGYNTITVRGETIGVCRFIN